jgi:hypothetical protein
MNLLFTNLYKYAGGSIEMRAFRGDKLRRDFFEIEDFKAISQWLNLYRDWNCFHGVGTRDGNGGRIENVVDLPAVWADIDFKNTPKTEAWKRIKDFIFPPSALITSGNGSHCYWFLNEPATQEDFETAVDVLHRLADYFGADHGVCDIARVLRTPSSMNHKYDPPREVKRIHIKKFFYELTDFQDILPESKHIQRKANGIINYNSERWLLEAFKGLSEGGNDQFAGRDAAAVKIAGYFVDRMTDADLLLLLNCWNVRNNPPLENKDLQRIVGSVSRYRKENHWKRNGTPSGIKVQFR